MTTPLARFLGRRGNTSRDLVAATKAHRSNRFAQYRALALEPLEQRRLLASDFGDAPVPYPTTLGEVGAEHTLIGPTLGANRDAELDGTHSANADADDTVGTPDDEDGVIVPVLTASTTAATTASLDIDLQNAAATTNHLDAWIDFNADGDWDDSGEQIFTSYNLGTNSGIQSATFTVPQDTGASIVYGTTYARFRLSTVGGLLPTGLAADGEVEDYQVAVTWLQPPQALNTNAGSDSGSDYVPQVATDGAGNWVAVWDSDDSLGGTIDTDFDILFTTFSEVLPRIIIDDGDVGNGASDVILFTGTVTVFWSNFGDF